MLAPSRSPLVGCPTPGSAYALESKLLKAYRRILHEITQEGMDALVIAVLGPPKPVKEKNTRFQTEDREERIDEKIPEVICMLRPEEQAELAPLLLEQGDIAAFARGVIALQSGQALRLRDNGPLLDDTPQFKSAGLGRLSKAAYTSSATFAAKALPTGGPPLVLVPPTVVAKPRLRTAKRRRGLHPMTLPGQLVFQWPVSAARVMEAGL